MKSRAFTILTLAAGLLAAGSPAPADWLVTRQGDRIETRGPWQEKGKLVVFHTAEGRLSSLRLADVDLAASRAATADAERARTEGEPAAAPPAAPLREVRAITDADVGRVREVAETAPATPADATETDTAKATPKNDLEVTSWDRTRAEDGHVVITGSLRNTSSSVVAGVRLTIRLIDETGTAIAEAPADLPAAALRGGEQVHFRADFFNVFGFATAQLEPKGVRLRSGAAPADSAAPSTSPDSSR